MIQIAKPVAGPDILRSRGVEECALLCTAYDKSPEQYKTGALNFAFKSSIYAHPSVVEALKTAQHRKCCFCERKMLGDVEHFRPKGGFSQTATGPVERPGYYWLAYDWDNLFLACGPCNQRFKRNFFPLRDPKTRSRNHHDEIQEELPCLLHPSRTDPEQHIGFHSEVAFAIGNSVEGTTTIFAMGLNHQELVESRRGLFNRTKLLLKNTNLLKQVIERESSAGRPTVELRAQLSDNLAELSRARVAQSEYAAMVRSMM